MDIRITCHTEGAPGSAPGLAGVFGATTPSASLEVSVEIIDIDVPISEAAAVVTVAMSNILGTLNQSAAEAEDSNELKEGDF